MSIYDAIAQSTELIQTNPIHPVVALVDTVNCNR